MRNDRWVPCALLAAFAAAVLWGYASADTRKLFRPHTQAERGAAQQKAIDRAFGKDDIAFDPQADKVWREARGRADTVSWKKLAQAHFKKRDATIDYGAVRALDGQSVSITGYMFPLQGAENQGHFILSAFPPSCPYCLPAGGNEMIEITEAEPVRFTYKPVTLRGQLHLSATQEQMADGLFYRMDAARVVAP